MASELIPAEVQQFILKRIDSIAQLEALLLMSGDPGSLWTVSALARRLYITEQETSGLLALLQSEGLIATHPDEPQQYQYQPGSDETDELVKRVLEVYTRHLVPVTNLVHAKTRTRIQKFADAFRLRKDE